MDLPCRHCREPWENDTLHDVAEETERTYREVAADFRNRGCEALGTTHNENGKPSAAADVLFELLGDDMDGVASMFEDLEMMGGVF